MLGEEDDNFGQNFDIWRVRLVYPALAVIVALITVIVLTVSRTLCYALSKIIDVLALSFVTLFIISMAGDDEVLNALQRIGYVPSDPASRAKLKAALIRGKGWNAVITALINLVATLKDL